MMLIVKQEDGKRGITREDIPAIPHGPIAHFHQRFIGGGGTLFAQGHCCLRCKAGAD